MGKILFLFCFFAPLFLFSQQIQKHTYANNGERIGFLEYTPSDYNAKASTKYPVIIFLHGIGERGNGTTELNRVKNISIPHYIDKGESMRFNWNGKWETFLVLSPQCPLKYGMWPVSYIDAMIDYAEKNLRIDKNRIFLAGLSMGGGGAWKYASSSLAHANRLAAIATVCAPPTLTNACNIAKSNLPLWAFHATDDKVVNISSLVDAVNRINNCNPKTPAKKTVWPTGGHNVWDRAFNTKHTYQSPNIYEWFLSQTRQTSSSPNQNPSSANHKPTANAGPDRTISLPQTEVWVTGGSSADKDRGDYISSIQWQKISGPSAYHIARPHDANAKITRLQPGTYTFRLTVKDGKGLSDHDDVKITVNAPPVANAGPDRMISLPQTEVWVTGGASADKDRGDYISSIQWQKISGPSSYHIARPHDANAKITRLQPGTYTFRLTVKDGKGASDYDDVKIKVNAPPLAKAGPDKTIVLPVNYVYLQGTRSVDPGGWIASFRWSQMNGPGQSAIANPNTGSTVIRNLKTGTYTFRLYVRDGDGATTFDEVNVRVVNPYKTQASVASLAKAEIAPPDALSTAEPVRAMEKENNDAHVAGARADAHASIYIFPNPASGHINIRCNSLATGKTMITVYDLTGRPVKRLLFEKDAQLVSKSVDISSLRNGVYAVNVQVNNTIISSGKFIKQ